MRIIALIFITFNISLAFAQTDSVVSVNKFVYDLNHGISVYHRYCSNQTTYNTNRQVIRETYYSKDKISGQISIDNIDIYFYDKDFLTSIETYDAQENPVAIKQYFYDKNGNIKKTSKGNIVSGNLEINEEEAYKYKKGKLVRITTKVNGKKASVTSYVHSDGKKISERVFYIDNPAESDLIKETIEKEFDENNLVSSKTIARQFQNKSEKETFKNTYNESNMLAESIVELDGQFKEKRKYGYNNKNELQTIHVYDEKNKLVDYNSFVIKKLIVNLTKFNSWLDK